MSKQTLWYRCVDHCDESFYSCETTENLDDPHSYRWAVTKAAKDYHSNHDGWESNWPLVFSLHKTEGGPELARFLVDRDVEPVFYAGAPI